MPFAASWLNIKPTVSLNGRPGSGASISERHRMTVGGSRRTLIFHRERSASAVTAASSQKTSGGSSPRETPGSVRLTGSRRRGAGACRTRRLNVLSTATVLLLASRDPGSYLGAWHLLSGTYAEAAACGSSWLERLNPDGTTTRFTVPGALGGERVQPRGAYGDQLALQVADGCARYPYSFLEWYNPATGVARPVLGGPAGGGYVTDPILFPAS